MFARIGVMRAFNRCVERVFNPDRKVHHWGRESWRETDDQRENHTRGMRSDPTLIVEPSF